MKLSMLSLPFLVATSLLGAQTPTCVSHFNNLSDFQWSITGFDGSPTKLMIQPGQTIVIPYTQATNLTVSGSIPNRPYTKQFQLQADATGCYTILYKGNPGYVRINKPNPGDVVTCSGGC